MNKTVILGTMLVFLAAPSWAQETPALVQLTNGNAAIGVLGLTVDQTVGKEVYDSEGNLLGTVAKVLGDDADTPTAVAVGGGGRIVVLELASAELINNRVVTQLSGEEYRGLPAFED